MRAVFKGALAAALLVGSSLAGTAPAQAHDNSGAAIAAGIIGLGIGAAIASDHHDRDYDRYSSGYDVSPGYYASVPAYDYGYDYSYGGSYRDYRDYRGHDRGRWDRHDRGDYRDRDDHRDYRDYRDNRR